MLFYNAPNPAPNPRRVRIFLAEKGVTVPMTDLGIMTGEIKSPDFLAINPLGQVPALKLDADDRGGEVITETVSICRYFEALHPDPPLFGNTPVEIARIDMWIRRAELRVGGPLAMIWQHTHPLTAKFLTQHKNFGESQRPRLADALAFVDGALAEHEFLAGKEYSMADIVLLTTIDFAGFVGIELPDELTHLKRWHATVSARPSATA